MENEKKIVKDNILSKKLVKKTFLKEFKKSLDFRNAKVAIDSNDQLLAEKTVNPKFIDYLKSIINADKEKGTWKIPLAQGSVALSKRDEGLYSGAFLDKSGAVVDSFGEGTIETIAKDIMIKGLMEGWEGEEEEETKEEEYSASNPHYIKIKCGDFEFEMRKSVSDFLKSSKMYGNKVLIKSIKSLTERWSKATSKETAEYLLDNWEREKEEFFQTLHGIEVLKKDE